MTISSRLWLAFSVLLIVLISALFFTQIRLGILTGLFLFDLLDERTVHLPDQGTLAWVTPSPVVQTLTIRVKDRNIPADLYYTSDGKRHAAILLTHGIIESGKDDLRLVRFARSLARVGFAVLVPELRGMKSLRIQMSDTDDIVSCFQHMASLNSLLDNRKMGLMGFSYGAGPTLIASANAAIRERVKFVVSFGGYYDPINVIRFVTTGTYEYGRIKGFLPPEPYGKWVFFINNVDYVESVSDRRVLREIFDKEAKGRKQEAAAHLEQLTPAGRSLYELLNINDPDRTEELVRKTDRRFQEYLKRISLVSVIPKVTAYLIIGHGSTDPLIPYTESLRLAHAVKDEQKVHVAILQLFSHVDPSRSKFSLRDSVTTYVPSLLRFYFLVYDLFRQQL